MSHILIKRKIKSFGAPRRDRAVSDKQIAGE